MIEIVQGKKLIVESEHLADPPNPLIGEVAMVSSAGSGGCAFVLMFDDYIGIRGTDGGIMITLAYGFCRQATGDFVDMFGNKWTIKESD